MTDLHNFQQLKTSWSKYWPSPNNAQNWDAICKIDNEWILIEAKAHKDEMNSDSKASEKSKIFISDRFDKIKTKYGITSQNDWNKNYYQKANRILFFEYLMDNNIRARLLFVYFVNGYRKSGEQLGVTSIAQWTDLIKKQDEYLGISNNKRIKDNIVDLIINIDK